MSDEELSHLLSKLQQGAQKLNEASDSINLIISSIEQKVVESNVGIECWLNNYPIATTEERRREDDDDVSHSTWKGTILGFAKLELEGWKFAIREIHYDRFKEFDQEERQWEEKTNAHYEHPTALWRATRTLRIAALEQMPHLMQSLVAETERSLEAISKAKKLVK
jgi:hypothetical protein